MLVFTAVLDSVGTTVRVEAEPTRLKDGCGEVGCADCGQGGVEGLEAVGGGSGAGRYGFDILRYTGRTYYCNLVYIQT